MNKQITRLGVGLLAAYLVLFAQLNWLQVFGASGFNEHPVNSRPVLADFGAPRGRILAADGTVLAMSVELDDGPVDRERQYPLGALFAGVTGYFSLDAGTDGIEQSWDDELRGDENQLADSIRELLGGDSTTADVRLTLSVDLQEAARNALGERRGSVVVLNAQSGAIHAMWSWPSFDPNPLSSVDNTVARQARVDLLADSLQPLLPKAIRELYFPGSTFKTVTAAAALESRVVTLDVPVFGTSSGYTPPLTTNEIGNFAGSDCGGPLRELLRRSCNSGFAQLAVELVGPDNLVATAEGFGFNNVPPVELPGVVASTMPDDFGEDLGTDVEVDPALLDQLRSVEPIPLLDNMPAFAQSAIGQFEVKATPLQMALVAAAIANDGDVPNPHVVRSVVDSEGAVLHEADLDPWRDAIRPATAANLREALVEVVLSGTAQRAAVDGLVVGAKTGTAQLGADLESTHAWLIAFAGDTIDRPEVAVAVLVEADEGVGEQTGGRVAGPIAQAVLVAWAETR